MSQNISKLETGIFELTQIVVLTSLISGMTSPYWDKDFKYTIGSILATSAVASIGLLTELSKRAYESKNKKLSDYDWSTE